MLPFNLILPVFPCYVVIPSQTGINYFNALVRHDSQQAEPQKYARLFMVPGMYHCLGGPGPNMFDAITPLVNWVEKGVAPETIIATKYVNDTPLAVQMTRPLCVFPKVAIYKGSGDAANFTCVADEPDFNQMPAPKYGP